MGLVIYRSFSKSIKYRRGFTPKHRKDFKDPFKKSWNNNKRFDMKQKKNFKGSFRKPWSYYILRATKPKKFIYNPLKELRSVRKNNMVLINRSSTKFASRRLLPAWVRGKILRARLDSARFRDELFRRYKFFNLFFFWFIIFYLNFKNFSYKIKFNLWCFFLFNSIGFNRFFFPEGSPRDVFFELRENKLFFYDIYYTLIGSMYQRFPYLHIFINHKLSLWLRTSKRRKRSKWPFKSKNLRNNYEKEPFKKGFVVKSFFVKERWFL